MEPNATVVDPQGQAWNVQYEKDITDPQRHKASLTATSPSGEESYVHGVCETGGHAQIWSMNTRRTTRCGGWMVSMKDVLYDALVEQIWAGYMGRDRQVRMYAALTRKD